MPEWDLLQAIYRVRGPAMRAYHKTPPPFQALLDEFGVQPQHAGEFKYMDDNYNMQAMSAEHYMRRNCYENAALRERILADMSAAGLFAPSANAGEYAITDKGRRFLERSEEMLGPRWVVPPIEGENLNRIIALLRRVVEVTKTADLPYGTWSVQTRAQHGYKVPAAAPPLQQLNEITFDLWALRDDAHLAAWRESYHELSPRAWETLSTLWQKEASNAATLAEVLKDHGFSADDYAESLKELIAHDWVVEKDGFYSLTDNGDQVRQRAETLTNEYFYSVFSVLNADERAELNTALENLLAALKSLAEPAPQ